MSIDATANRGGHRTAQALCASRSDARMLMHGGVELDSRLSEPLKPPGPVASEQIDRCPVD